MADRTMEGVILLVVSPSKGLPIQDHSDILALVCYMHDNLVEREGADDALRDAEGKTALQWAQLNSRTDVGLLLNARGAK